MKVYDRLSGGYIEAPQYGQGALESLYGKPFGRFLLKIVITPATSRFYGWLKRRPSSIKDIPAFIDDYHIKIEDFEERKYTSFSDFFTRKIKPGARTVDLDDEAFISPADSKVLIYRITDDAKLSIKGSEYTVEELVGTGTDTSSFANGYALVFRLSMDDYHRYCFADNGSFLSKKYIRGKLHTVSSISSKYKIYKENSRVVNHLQTDNFDDIYQIEVGALLVGKMVNYDVKTFNKGDEKGYFEPGGSTVIILVKDNVVRLDDDIMEQSSNGIETKVLYGERIGKRI